MHKTTLVALLLIISASLFAQNQKGPPLPPDPPVFSDSSTRIFTFVEQEPTYPGGEKEMLRFLQQHVQYPARERRKGIQGRVLVRFVVDENGDVKDVYVTRGVSPGLDAEAVRVVKLFPRFLPGKQQGKAVKVYYNLPIVFKLS